MKRLFVISGALILIICMIMVHFAVLYFLPYPWHTINTAIIFLTVIIIGWESGFAVWIAMLFSFLIELYSGSHFGLVLFSLTIATLCSFWVYQVYFQQRTWFSGFGLSFVMLLLFRLIYSLLFLFISFVGEGDISWRNVLPPYVSEIVLTPLFSGVLIYVLSKVTETFEPVRTLTNNN